MNRNATSEDGNNGEGSSQIPNEEPIKDRQSQRYRSDVQSSDHGQKYQRELALLLLFRATLRNIHFRLAYEMTDAGKFDDIIFVNEDTKECLLFQVKHGSTTRKRNPVQRNMLFPTNAKKRKTEDFSLCKYLKSYASIQQDLSGENRFIIFTNRQLATSDQLLEKVTIEHLAPESILYFNDLIEKPLRLRSTHAVAKEMMNYVNQKLAMKVSLEDVSDFFGNLELYFNQPDELGSIIRNELLGWMRTWIHPVDLGKTDMKECFKYTLAQLEECLELNSEYDKATKSKAFLTLKQGKKCLFEIRQHLEEKIGVFNFVNSTLTTVEDYFINRCVRLSDTSNASDDRDYDFFDLLTGRYAEDKIIVLTAKPGMGKSVLFHHVSLQIQQSSNDLVFLIYLNNLIDNLKQIQQIDGLETTLKILKNVLFASNRSIILAASKSESSNGQRIRMFLDGFDEIAPMHEEKVIQMIQTLKVIERIQIIVSGRRHVENKLKETFNGARSLFLMPFSRQDQTAFLRKRWKVSVESESKFNTYSAHILDKLDSCIDNSSFDFLGIPLMIKMSADVQEHDFNRFLTSNIAQDTGSLQSFTVVKLYEEFIENILDLKFEKMFKSGCRENESKEEFFQKHQLLAFDRLGHGYICHLKDNPSVKAKFDQFVQKIINGEERSPLVECVNGEVQFIHRSYAEYMVAKYLFDNIEKSKHLFDFFIAMFSHEVVKIFFLDMIKEKGKPMQFKRIAEMYKIHNYLHDSMVNQLFEEGCFNLVENLIEHNSSFVHNFYPGLRNDYGSYQSYCQLIHFAAEYGHEKIVHMLIEKGANINAQCSNKSTPLHYAIKHKNMVQLLLNYSVNVNVQNCDGETPLHRAIQWKQTEVVKLLIEHHVDENKMIVVNQAAKFGKISILRPILNKMVHENYQDGLGSNPLHSADSESYADACKLELERLLLQTSVDVNFEDFDGKTPLHYAAETTQLELVKYLLPKLARINLQDKRGKTPLHYAAKSGHDQIVELLLKKIEDVNLQDFEGKTPLHYAAEAGYLQIVELLLKKTEDVHFTDIEGKKALHYASKAYHYEIIKLLMKKSSEDDFMDSEGTVPLEYALEACHDQMGELLNPEEDDFISMMPIVDASEARPNQNVEMLLEKTEDVNLRDAWGTTLLHFAAMGGYRQIVDKLLRKSVDIDVQNCVRRTPLHYAAEGGHHQIVELLLEKTADIDAPTVNLKDLYGKTPLHYAAEGGHELVVKLLIEKSADVNVKGPSKQTPLLLAAIAGKHATVELLFYKSEDLNIQDTEGRTLLHYTAKLGLTELVILLFKNVGDVDLQDKFKKTPLHYAAEAGNHQIVKLLLEKSADVDAQDSSRKTPLHYAAQTGHKQTVCVLLKHSKNENLPDLEGKISLHYAAEAGHFKIVELMLNPGNIRLCDNNGRIPLHYAAKAGQLQLVKLLLVKMGNVDFQDMFNKTQPHNSTLDRITEDLFGKSVDLNFKYSKGQTALHYATQSRPLQIVKLLLEQSCDVNIQDIYGRTALHYLPNAESFEEECARVKDVLKIVELLLGTTVDVNIQDIEGKTTLHLAVEVDAKQTVELLMRKLVNINLQDIKGRTPLHYAAEIGHLKSVVLMMEKYVDISLQDNEGKTALHYAAELSESEIVQLLLRKLFDVNLQDSGGRTPLHYASIYGHLKSVELMLEKSVDISLQDSVGKTALHYAAVLWDWKIVQLLLIKLFDVNLQDIKGRTPLHYAAVGIGYPKTIELMLEKSVDVSLQDNEGKTALHYAARLWEEKIFELFLRKLFDVNLQDNEGRTPLHCAAEAGRTYVVRLLLEHSADPSLKDSEGRTPLHYAVDKCYLWTSDLLIKSVNVNVQDFKGRTALHYVTKARKNEKVETYGRRSIEDAPGMVELLLHKSADVNIQDNEGKTPVHYAAEAGCQKIFNLLLEKSGDVTIQDSFNKLPIDYATQEEHQQIVAMLSRIDINKM